MIHTLIFRLLPIFLLTLGAHAQSVGDSGKKAGGARVRFVSLQKLPQSKYEILQLEKKTAVEISDWNISQPIRLAAEVPSKLLSGAEDTALASFKLPPEKADLLAVLMADPQDQSGKYKVTLLNVSPAEFRGGERYAINLSAFPILIRFGSTNTKIEPGTIGKIETPRGKDGDFLPVHAVFRQGEKDKLFMSSRWVRDSRARTLLFIYPDSGRKSLSWHGLDVPAPGKEARGNNAAAN